MANNPFSENTPYLHRLAEKSNAANGIVPDMYTKYNVKRGLRDINGRGVLTGLTEISEIVAAKEVGGETVPADGELYYRGINVRSLAEGFQRDGRYGFEECVYLLLFGTLRVPESFPRLRSAGSVPLPAHEFRARHNTQSAQPRYDEHPCAKRAHSVRI